MQGALRERAEREGVVRTVIAEAFRQRAALRVAAAVGELGLEDAGGARAEKQSDTLWPVARRARGHRLPEAVLTEREPREAVVAAVELGELARQRRLIDSGDLTDTGVEAHGLEAAGSESA